MTSKSLAQEIAEQSIVLLKNDPALLPLAPETGIAVFGRAQCKTVFSGNGSGGMRSSGTSVLDACEQAGVRIAPALAAFYRRQAAFEPESGGIDWELLQKNGNSGLAYELFGQYHAPLPEPVISTGRLLEARMFSDTALLVLGRNSGGEECDRRLKDDYYLTASEEALVQKVCDTFPKVILVLNLNGLIDLAWTEQCPSIGSILFLGIPGEDGAAALAEILTGQVSPCGKLAFTIARRYEDYPSAEDFSWTKENVLTYDRYGLDAAANGSTGFAKSPVTVYREGIFAGYRYFDTFGVEPLYPFGFGLSYTAFTLAASAMTPKRGGLEVKVTVKNTGNRAGREVVQLYQRPTGVSMDQPLQKLWGFGKTQPLLPGQSETLTLLLPWRELAAYDEERAAWVIGQGLYLLYLGASSRDTRLVCAVSVPEEIHAEQCANRLGLQACNRGKIDFLTHRAQDPQSGVSGFAARMKGQTGELPRDLEILSGNPELVSTNKEKGKEACVRELPPDAPDTVILTKELAEEALIIQPEIKSGCTEAEMLKSEHAGKSAIAQRECAASPQLPELSTEEMAALCVGYGPGVAFAALSRQEFPNTICGSNGAPLTVSDHPAARPGYVSPAIPEKGIHSVSYKDGPAGVGKTAWPTEMLMACSFDRALWRSFGEAIGGECRALQVDFLLAPAVNLHRNPLGGRNFEYFSEDPYLTGCCGVEIALGAAQAGVMVCPKHFAANEQETCRRGSAKLHCDAVDSILTERTLREIYLKPFEMLVRQAHICCIMTSFNKINGVFAAGNSDLCTHILREEWGFTGAVVTDWGDMDVVVDGADAVAAGNDIVMPGGPPVIAQILKGLSEGRVTEAQLEKAVGHLLLMIAESQNRAGI